MITKILILIGFIFVFGVAQLICLAIKQVGEECDSEKYWEEHELDDGADN